MDQASLEFMEIHLLLLVLMVYSTTTQFRFFVCLFVLFCFFKEVERNHIDGVGRSLSSQIGPEGNVSKVFFRDVQIIYAVKKKKVLNVA